MTWKEFKEAVEAQGVTDGDEIEYIDISHPDHVSVGFEEYPKPAFRKADTVVSKMFHVVATY